MRKAHLLTQTMHTICGATAWSKEQVDAKIASLVDLLDGINPSDAVEAMLATQMIATHEAAMECLRRSGLPEQSRQGRDLDLKHATKLMSVYERQVAALDKHRGRGQQNVTVEYVHVSEGGQAIVGNVAHPAAASIARGTAAGAGRTGGDDARCRANADEGGCRWQVKLTGFRNKSVVRSVRGCWTPACMPRSRTWPTPRA